MLTQLGATMVKFDNWFEVLPGTKKGGRSVAETRTFQDDATYYEGP